MPKERASNFCYLPVTASGLLKNANGGSVLKGRGFKPRRKSNKSIATLAAERHRERERLFQQPTVSTC
jgi:hypothetical protein